MKRSTAKNIFRYLFALPQKSTAALKVVKEINASIVVIIPTHRPNFYTGQLVRNLLDYNKKLDIRIIVVNDQAPVEYHHFFDSFVIYDKLRVTVLDTPKNTLKAGAINYALKHIKTQKIPADIIVTVDDDVILHRQTIKAMAKELLENEKYGAVCSLAQVANKNENLLTRLQGLEYSQFNCIRVADHGYLFGPLVMHGMATAFRAKALKQVKGFTENHLVEDYDITARLKDAGWQVGLAANAPAHTIVPTGFKSLWRQRARWNTGGIEIITNKHRLEAVFQDWVGHLLFIINLIIIDLSLIFPSHASHREISIEILLMALFFFALSYGFTLNQLRYYRDADWKDWLLRMLILPELFYSIYLTLNLIGTYLFFVSREMKKLVFRSRVDWVTPLDKMFNKLGYSQKWGTI